MADILRFDGQVVLITGAGGGLGRAYAILFASRGAKVVVNDLGGKISGEGSDTRAADLVVEEIKLKGGLAVADYNSVEEGEKVVKTALDHFGRVDILINNAGILRDRSFARTSELDWDMVQRVHLRGSFMMSRAVWPIMRRQGYGKIIMTSSIAGIYGNFGQANYSAAKLGLVGFSNTLAIEGQSYNIHCNTVVPLGGTRLTDGLMPPDLFNELKPDLVAPLVLWLCHSNCEENGGVFEAAGGWFGKYRWERTKGAVCRRTMKDAVNPEDVRDRWEEISSFNDSLHLENQAEDAGAIAMTIEEMKDNAQSDSPDSTKGVTNINSPLSGVGKSSTGSFTYDSKDVILYALGVGMSVKHSEGLKFLFEGHDSFCTLPTFGIVPLQDIVIGNNTILLEVPDWIPDLPNGLHGEQYTEVLKPLPTSGTVKTTATIVDVLDKGSGATIIIDANMYDENEEHLVFSQWVIFMVGNGNFGGPRTSSKQISILDSPIRQPDLTACIQTTVDQGAVYRLSGDRNAIHIDPEFSALGGFKEPILHGLCSYGMVARTVLKMFCNDDTDMFRAIKTRFAKPVIPGQTLVVDMWQEKRRIFFEAKIKGSDKTCLTGGYVDLNSDPAEGLLENMRKLSVIDETLSSMVHILNKKEARNLGEVFLWNITVDDKSLLQWTFKFVDPVEIYEGPPKCGDEATCTIDISPDDFISFLNGNYLNSISKRIKITGAFNYSLSNVLYAFKLESKL